MTHTDGAGSRPRMTFIAAAGMVLASAVNVLIGAGGLTLWTPDMMMLSYWQQLSGGEWAPARAVSAFVSAGPVIAAAGLVLGWAAFLLLRRPGAGIRLVVFPPAVWGVLVLAWLAVTGTVCAGDPTCGL